MRALSLSLPDHQQRRPYWEYAAQLLMDAAEGGKREAIDGGLVAAQAGAAVAEVFASASWTFFDLRCAFSLPTPPQLAARLSNMSPRR
jgi:hypothetical protein